MKTLETRLLRETGRAIIDYGMIEEGDCVAVAVSGGKDSLAMLDMLLKLQRRAPIRFEIVAVTVDQGYEGFRWPVMEKHFRDLGVAHHIQNTRIVDTIEDHKNPGDTWCSLCARLRRGVLYRLAREKGWTKIALGHHADDLIETLLLSQLFNGAILSMPPILRADDGVNVVIRPLAYVWESDIVAYAKAKAFPIICCACPACTDLTLKRRRVKALLQELETSWPGVKRSLLSAQSRVKVTQLMDPRFLPLGATARLRAAAAAPAAEPEPPEEIAAGCAAGDAVAAAEPLPIAIGGRSSRSSAAASRARVPAAAGGCGAACSCGPLAAEGPTPAS